MICPLCSTNFGSRVTIDGVVHNVGKRKFCLSCSPFKEHNTRSVKQMTSEKEFHCPCGETDPKQFRSDRYRFRCKNCFLKYNAIRCQTNKNNARQYLGGQCIACGYSKYLSALAFHHLNPSKKDLNWATMRGWSWSRIISELKHCILLCSNCHTAFHAGENIFEERCTNFLARFGASA